MRVREGVTVPAVEHPCRGGLILGLLKGEMYQQVNWVDDQATRHETLDTLCRAAG
jgi:hypothetical protein